MPDDDRSAWTRTFDDVSQAKGDTEAANRYVSVRNFRFVREMVLAEIGQVRNAVILDVGCGTGHFARPLAGENRVVGIDISRGMLLFARNKGIVPVQSAAERLPFAEGRFDILLANSVIQLIPDGKVFIREALRVVRPGGRVLITTINAESIALALFRRFERKKYKHFRLYSCAELKERLTEAGGEIRNVHYLFFPMGRARCVQGNATAGAIIRKLATSLIVDAVRRG